MMRAIGFVILSAVFTGIFVATTKINGWREAVMVWSVSILVTGLVVLGVLLATGATS